MAGWTDGWRNRQSAFKDNSIKVWKENTKPEKVPSSLGKGAIGVNRDCHIICIDFLQYEYIHILYLIKNNF